ARGIAGAAGASIHPTGNSSNALRTLRALLPVAAGGPLRGLAAGLLCYVRSPMRCTERARTARRRRTARVRALAIALAAALLCLACRGSQLALFGGSVCGEPAAFSWSFHAQR